MRSLLLPLCLLPYLSAGAAETSSAAQQVLWDKFAARVNQFDTEFNGVLGVALVDLTSKQKWELRGQQVFPTASTIKLAVLAKLYREEDLAKKGEPGHVHFLDKYLVDKNDLVADSAVLGNLTPGVTILTNRDLAAAVVAVSDNSASNILTNRLGMAAINSLLQSLGLSRTQMRRNMMDLAAARQGRENIASPSDLVALLSAIYDKKVFSEELTADFLALLSTPKDGMISRRLPETVRVANKPGELAGVRCDAGIVFVPGRPFAIAVMTTYDEDEREAEDVISRIAEAAWRMFDRFAASSEYGRQISERNSR